LKNGKVKILEHHLRSQARSSSALQKWYCHPVTAGILELASGRSLWMNWRKVCSQCREGKRRRISHFFLSKTYFLANS
jgi:hypothetical protein